MLLVNWQTVEAVEDQVEADLELAAIAIARLENMADGHLGEVRVLPGRHLVALRD